MRLACSQYPSWQPEVGLQKQALTLLAQPTDQFLKNTLRKYMRRPRSAWQTLTAAPSQRTAATCSMSCSRLRSCAPKRHAQQRSFERWKATHAPGGTANVPHRAAGTVA